MIQHVLLLVVAAPLIVLARPWIRLWRSLPLDARRSARARPQPGRAHALGCAAEPSARSARWPASSRSSVVLLALARAGAVRRDAALVGAARARAHAVLRHGGDVLEAGDRTRRRCTRGCPRSQRVVYLIGAMIVSWVLAVVLALAPASAVRASTRTRPSRPGGISALTDQQLAAGIMWVPGSITLRDRYLRLRPPLADAARAGHRWSRHGWRASTRRISCQRSRHPARRSLPHRLDPELALPLGVLIVVAVWYVVLLRRGAGER